MGEDPFESPRTDSAAAQLPRLEPLELSYALEFAPMKTQVRMLATNRTVLTFVAMLVGGSILGVTAGAGWLILAVVGGGYLAWIIVSLVRSPYVGSGGTVQMEVSVSAAGLQVRVDAREETFKWAELAYYDESADGFVAQPRVGTTLVFPKAKLDLVAQERLREWLSHLLTKGSPQAQAKPRTMKTLVLWVLLIVVFWAIYQVIAHDDARRPPPAARSAP